MSNSIEIAKQAVGAAAADLIQENMIVGLGTGSTATFFIDSLIERCRCGNLKIAGAIATSEQSALRAQAGGITLLDIKQITALDITVDGADEIDTSKQMIKGGGGALLREKIIASMSREMVVIIDEHKLVDHLGVFPLPIEVVPFALEFVLRRMQSLGYRGTPRTRPDGKLYITDNGNYIIDISFPNRYMNPERDHAILREIPGVIETGFFFKLAGRVLIGHNDGTVKLLN